MWSIDTKECDSAMKGKEGKAFAATWVDLEMITGSEVGQTGRHQHHVLSLPCGI